MNLLKNYLTNIADLGEKEDYKDLHKIYNLYKKKLTQIQCILNEKVKNHLIVKLEN
jgi:hypothetical protein